MDPVSEDLLHADFLAVKENEQVKVRVPVVLTGRSGRPLRGHSLADEARD